VRRDNQKPSAGWDGAGGELTFRLGGNRNWNCCVFGRTPEGQCQISFNADRVRLTASRSAALAVVPGSAGVSGTAGVGAW